MSFRSSHTRSQLQVIDMKLGLAYGRGECLKRMWILKEEATKLTSRFQAFEPTNKNKIRAKRLRWLSERWAVRAAEGRMEFMPLVQMR